MILLRGTKKISFYNNCFTSLLVSKTDVILIRFASENKSSMFSYSY